MAYIYPFRMAEEKTILAVWSKGGIVPDKDGQHWDPKEWRYDLCGKPIRYLDHGNTNSKYGWEIDHIKPVAKGGADNIANLQPLQWESNRIKGDDYPWSCP
ncbi:MAG TPA: HNH endonuclease signature motif containing protein [Syntrophales bacterium]|nr:HNH endonuclease signature motif containing protein [Syntrophales bacterium]